MRCSSIRRIFCSSTTQTLPPPPIVACHRLPFGDKVARHNFKRFAIIRTYELEMNMRVVLIGRFNHGAPAVSVVSFGTARVVCGEVIHALSRTSPAAGNTQIIHNSKAFKSMRRDDLNATPTSMYIYIYSHTYL